ncbi:MAG: hypothetical protein ACM3PF_00110 [Bacteroidota bacterium]
MTSQGRIIVPLALAFFVVLTLCPLTPPSGRAQSMDRYDSREGSASTDSDAWRRTARRARFAYVPRAIWGAALESATSGLGLTPNAIYWYEGTDDMGRVIGDVERYQADDAKASPHDALVAFVGRYAAGESETLQPGVAVMDTAGALVADFPRAESFGWSPDGTRLVVVYARTEVREGQTLMKPPRGRRGTALRRKAAGGVQVWDRRNNTARYYAQWPLRAGWAGSDTLLLQFPDRVMCLDLVKGAVKASEHQGFIVSPDGLYSLRPGGNGADTRIAEDATDDPITTRVFRPFLDRDQSQIRSAFWLRARDAAHLMCVSGCAAVASDRPDCSTEVVDVGTFETVASFRGEALGPTADERGVILFHADEGRLEFHDLRSVPTESTDGLSTDHESTPSGEFY